MENNSPYPPSRLAEMLAAGEDRRSGAGDAPDAPPALVAALRESASAYFAELPESEQVDMLRCLPPAERDDLLADLPMETQSRLQERLSSGMGMSL